MYSLLPFFSGSRSSKAYCYKVCQDLGWDEEPNYMPGATFPELVLTLVTHVNKSDSATSPPQVLISMFNGIVEMNEAAWEKQKQHYKYTVELLSSHINIYKIPHLLVLGADVSLWTHAPFPDVYRGIQKELFAMLQDEGLTCYTGMEHRFRGGFGQFRGKLDACGHIMGYHRDAAEDWLRSVLNACPRRYDGDAATEQPARGPLTSGSPISTPPLQPPRPPLPPPPFSSTSALDFYNFLGQVPKDDEKVRWKECGADRNYPWAQLPAELPAVTGRLVAVCTSGDENTSSQHTLVCQMMTRLGWRPVKIIGVSMTDAPPKSWKICCKATFAWLMRLAPQICRIAASLREQGEQEELLVAEDSVWPTELCTPEHVAELYENHDKPLWLACYLKPKKYSFPLWGRTFSCKAAAGCKLFYGNDKFWLKVNTLFDKLPKDYCTDSIFQLLVGMGELKFVYPALGATLKHYSCRTHNAAAPESSPNLELKGKLLDLPRWWEEQMGL